MRRAVSIVINGLRFDRTIDVRLLLSDFIRHEAGLTGTHVGCEHGICGACTVQVDGTPIRSCTMLAVQAEHHEVRTVEALSAPADALHPLQQALHETHGLQCGFCTPGFLMLLEPLWDSGGSLDEEEVRAAISGNLCRCTGYQQIISAVILASQRKREGLPERRHSDHLGQGSYEREPPPGTVGA